MAVEALGERLRGRPSDTRKNVSTPAIVMVIIRQVTYAQNVSRRDGEIDLGQVVACVEKVGITEEKQRGDPLDDRGTVRCRIKIQNLLGCGSKARPKALLGDVFVLTLMLTGPAVGSLYVKLPVLKAASGTVAVAVVAVANRLPS